jgi:tRNA U55 pseudouridine synthase TruB
MTDLVRTRIGGFGLESAVTLDRIEADPEGLEQALLPLALGVTALATVTLDDEAMTRLCHGVKIDASEAALEDPSPADDGGREYALLDRRGLLRVVAELSQGRFHPRRVFPEITTPR